MWKLNGCPDKFNLVELGPGKGTLMKDLLRATKITPAFHKAMNICLVELNSSLRLTQEKNIKHHSVNWYSQYQDVPESFSIIIANEFFDALPINQYTKKKDDWFINMVDLNEDKQCLYVNQFDASPAIKEFLHTKYPTLQNNSIVETQDETNIIMGQISKNIHSYGGAALIIDYGYTESIYRNYISTLQAVKDHEYSPIFEEVGNADISSHVNFTTLYDIANLYQTNTYGPITQREFLSNMYIDLRKNILFLKANKKQKQEILSGYDRLINPNQMGKLFKAIALTDKKFNPSNIGF
jgi:SAM-dependent MidA family methyltransferase